MTLKHSLFMGALMAALAISAQGQDENRDRGDRGQRDGNRPERGRFDPAQFRERMATFWKEQLEITDDSEWKAIEPRIQKVQEARIGMMGGMGRGGFGGGPGGFGGRPGGDDNQRGPLGQPNPEADTLRKAVEGKASNSELKSAIAKVQESRKVKQAELEKAQEELRQVLSVRQEAIATLRGLL